MSISWLSCGSKPAKPAREFTVDDFDDMIASADELLTSRGVDKEEHALNKDFLALKAECNSVASMIESIHECKHNCKWIPVEEQMRLCKDRVDNIREKYRKLFYASLTQEPPLVVMSDAKTNAHLESLL